MIASRARGRDVMSFGSPGNDLSLKSIRFTVWGVQDDLAYHIYVTNEGWDAHTMSLQLGSLGTDPLSYAVVTAVAPNPQGWGSYHGEVSATPQLGDARTVAMDVRETSFYRITVPKGSTDRLASEAVADATVRAAGGSPGNEPTLVVSTADAVSVAVMRFNIDGQVGDQGIVTSVLQLHLEAATNSGPQVLLVLAMGEEANEGVDWGRFATLKGVSGPITKASDNFINWRDGTAVPAVAGHMTVPPAGSIPPEGVFLRLEVTDSVRAGYRNFMVVRMVRYDQSEGQPPSQLAADFVEGTYTFSSREAENPDLRPKLLVDYVVPRRQ